VLLCNPVREVGDGKSEASRACDAAKVAAQLVDFRGNYYDYLAGAEMAAA